MGRLTTRSLTRNSGRVDLHNRQTSLIHCVHPNEEEEESSFAYQSAKIDDYGILNTSVGVFHWATLLPKKAQNNISLFTDRNKERESFTELPEVNRESFPRNDIKRKALRKQVSRIQELNVIECPVTTTKEENRRRSGKSFTVPTTE